jgi:hypothetical protein
LDLAAQVEEIKQNDKKKGEKYGKDQRHTVRDEEFQVFQGNEPDMSQLFHDFLPTSGHGPE